MHSRRLLVFGLALLSVIVLVGGIVWLGRLRPAAPPILSAASFSDLPGWSDGVPRMALQAFRRSCVRLLEQRPSLVMGYAGTVGDWQPVCRRAEAANPENAAAFFEQNFAPFAIRDGTDGLFTGYYEPLLNGSRARHGAFQTPVYGVPDDLVSVDLGAFKPELKGEHVAGRVVDGRLRPYASRAEIDARPPSNTTVLFYCDDPVAVFFLHIQGSGRVRLDSGGVIRAAYAGQNGRPYTAIGRTLIRRGALTRANASLQTIRAWLKANPAGARQVMETDASFVFFKEEPVADSRLGPEGSEGVPLTPGASLAVDPRIHPFGVPVFLSVRTPDSKPLNRLFVAQDTGGAIRGAARADIFFGFGADAEWLAGGMKSSGTMFVLLPRAVAKRLSG